MTRKPLYFLFPLLTALATPAAAQDESLAQSAQPPQRTSVLYTFGDDPCPEPVGDEIIVCAQQPESERYRVPKELREELKEDVAVGGGSWASTVEGYDNIARSTRPNSCPDASRARHCHTPRPSRPSCRRRREHRP